MLKTEELNVQRKFAELGLTQELTLEIAKKIVFQEQYTKVLGPVSDFVSKRISKIRRDEHSLFEIMKENRYGFYDQPGILVLHTIPTLENDKINVLESSNLESKMSDLQFFEKDVPLTFYEKIENRRIFFDGFFSYTSVFENGRIESVSNYLYSNIGKNNHNQLSSKVIYPGVIIPMLTNAIHSHLKLTSRLNVNLLTYLQVTLLNLENVSIFNKNIFPSSRMNDKAVTRRELKLPASIVVDHENHKEILISQLDYLWHEFGLESCPYVSKDGNFSFELDQ